MTDFLKIAKSIVVHFAHICAYGVETVKEEIDKYFVADMDEKDLLKFSLLLHMFRNMQGKKIQIGKDLRIPPFLCSHLTWYFKESTYHELAIELFFHS